MSWWFWGLVCFFGLVFLQSAWNYWKRQRHHHEGTHGRLELAKDVCALGADRTLGVAVIVVTTSSRRREAVRAVQSVFDLAECPFRLRVYVLEAFDGGPRSSTKTFMELYEALDDHAWGRPWTSQIKHWRMDASRLGGSCLHAATQLLHSRDAVESALSDYDEVYDDADDLGDENRAARKPFTVREPFTVVLGDGVVLRVPQWERFVLAQLKPGTFLTQAAAVVDGRKRRSSDANDAYDGDGGRGGLFLASSSSAATQVLDDVTGAYAQPAWFPVWDRVSDATSLPVVGARPLAPTVVGFTPLVSSKTAAGLLAAEATDSPKTDSALRAWSHADDRHTSADWWSLLREPVPVIGVTAEFLVGETFLLRQLLLSQGLMDRARGMVQSVEFLAWLLCMHNMAQNADFGVEADELLSKKSSNRRRKSKRPSSSSSSSLMSRVENPFFAPVVSMVRAQAAAVPRTAADALRRWTTARASSSAVAAFGLAQSATHAAAELVCTTPALARLGPLAALTLVPEYGLDSTGARRLFARAQTMLGARARMGTTYRATTSEIMAKFGSIARFEQLRAQHTGQIT